MQNGPYYNPNGNQMPPAGAPGSFVPPQGGQMPPQGQAPMGQAPMQGQMPQGQMPGWQTPPQPQPIPPQQAPQPQPAPLKKSKTWLIVLVVVALVFLGCVFGVSQCMSSVASVSTLSKLDDGVETTGPSVAVINLSGTIQYDGSACSPEGFKKLLDRAEKNPDIKAVVLRVNSGGGTATAGEEMTEYLKKFSKPVVVSSAATNASAAYEISSQANYIYVAKSTAIGSIGTVMQLTNMEKLYELLGIQNEVIKSADSKDSTYGLRPLTKEEREQYQHQVDQITDVFIQNVSEGRTAAGRAMGESEVRKLATGMTFTGTDAVENGLADEIGTLDDATAKAAELASMGSDYQVVNLRLESSELLSLLSLMGAKSQQEISAADIAKAIKELEANELAAKQ